MEPQSAATAHHLLLPPADVQAAAARWLTEDPDFALGAECANPMLQIERWGQDDGSADRV